MLDSRGLVGIEMDRVWLGGRLLASLRDPLLGVGVADGGRSSGAPGGGGGGGRFNCGVSGFRGGSAFRAGMGGFDLDEEPT